MLNSAEHDTLNAHKKKKYQEIQHFSGSDEPRIFFCLLMPKFQQLLAFQHL